MTRSKRILLLAIMALGLSAQALAEPVKTKYSTIDLVAEQASLPADGGSITLGFYIEPDQTWHAYWANPGDAGMEPSVDWDLPDGFEAGAFVFPNVCRCSSSNEGGIRGTYEVQRSRGTGGSGSSGSDQGQPGHYGQRTGR